MLLILWMVSKFIAEDVRKSWLRMRPTYRAVQYLAGYIICGSDCPGPRENWQNLELFCDHRAQRILWARCALQPWFDKINPVNATTSHCTELKCNVLPTLPCNALVTTFKMHFTSLNSVYWSHLLIPPVIHCIELQYTQLRCVLIYWLQRQIKDLQ